MKPIDIYKNLCIEIDMIENVLQDIRAEIKTLQYKMYKAPADLGGMVYDGMPKGSADHTSFDRLYNRLVRLIEEEEHHSKQLEEKNKLKQKLIEQYREITGLENQVQYLRDVRGLRLWQIAEQLGYSEEYVRRISSKIPKNAL